MIAAPTGRFAVVAEQFFDGEALHRAPHTVRVAGGRVLAVEEGDFEPSLAAAGWTVERGALLLPGLVDAHAHLFLDGACTDARHRADHLRKPIEQLTEGARLHAREASAWGVTLVRDAGDRHGINHAIRGEAGQAGSGMAQVRSAGRGIKRAGRYGAFMGVDVEGSDGLPGLVQELARDSDEIKLILTGVIDFDARTAGDEPQFTAAETRLVVEAAHRCGRKVLAHCSGLAGLDVAVGAGVDCIEHGFFMDRVTLAHMRDRDLAWTPTFCPVHFQWAHPKVSRWPAGTIARMRRVLDEHCEHLRLAHEMGVRLLVGTDAGSMGVQHGRAVLEEIWHFLDAGLPLEPVLRAATGAPRRHFGLPHPRLARGAPFEAVLFQAPPFDDGRVLHRPRKVWTSGSLQAAAEQLE